MEKYLKPLKTRRKKVKFAVGDLEANNWIDCEMVGFFDGRTYVRFDTVKEFIDFILCHRYRDYSVYFHNGGKYDFQFLMCELDRRNIKFTCIEQGARITALKVNYKGRTYKFLDSFALMHVSLAKLSKTFTPHFAKLTGAIDFEKEKVDRKNPDHQKYLEHDCKSLYEIISQYLQLPIVKDIGIKLTEASTAMTAIRTFLPHKIKVSPQYIQEFVRKSYAGGRTEIFKMKAGESTRYDVNSLYPYQMFSRKIPVEHLGRSSSHDEFGFHDVTVDVPYMHVPPLYTPFKIGVSNKLIFPTGVFRGVFFSEELLEAEKLGVRIIKHHEGHAFSDSSELFTEFIRTLYKLRLDNPGDNPVNFIAKRLMNSGYGKFAERDEKDSIERVDPKDPSTWPEEFTPLISEKLFKKTGLIRISELRRAPHALVHIGAAITAYGRMTVLPMLTRAGETLHYSDTDSLDTSSELPTGTELGQLKEEFKINRGIYLLPKAYILKLNNGQTIKKIKGFGIKDLDNVDFPEFESGKIKASRKKFATLKTSLMRNNTYLSLVDWKREIISVYDKRKILPQGATRAWEIREGILK